MDTSDSLAEREAPGRLRVATLTASATLSVSFLASLATLTPAGDFTVLFVMIGVIVGLVAVGRRFLRQPEMLVAQFGLAALSGGVSGIGFAVAMSLLG